MQRRHGPIITGMAAVLISAALLSCMPQQRVRVDLDEFRKNPGDYERAELIITATIGDVLDRYAEYRDRRIEITAPFTYYGRRGYWTWYVLLEEDGRSLRCFTHHYRLRVGRDAESLLLRAGHNREPVTINGILRKDGIEIREIWYDNQIVRPNVKPPTTLLYYPRFYF